LKPLPVDVYVPLITLGRRVSRDGFVAYNGNEYSVPDGLKKKEIEVRATLEEVGLYQDGRCVASHLVLEGKGQRRLDPTHRRQSKPDPVDSPFEESGEIIEVQRRPLEVYEGVLR